MAAEYSTFAGETLEFSFSFADYPADDGWTAAVHLRCGASKVTVALAASGSAHVATVAAATTANYAPGIYDLHVMVAKDGESYVATESQLAVRPNPGAATVAATALETELAAVNASIAAVLAGEGVQAYTIQTQAGSRNVQRMSLEDLRDHRRYLEGKIDKERAEMGLKPNNRTWKRIGVKFA